jgi:hypothetical protein
MPHGAHPVGVGLVLDVLLPAAEVHQVRILLRGLCGVLRRAPVRPCGEPADRILIRVVVAGRSTRPATAGTSPSGLPRRSSGHADLHHWTRSWQPLTGCSHTPRQWTVQTTFGIRFFFHPGAVGITPASTDPLQAVVGGLRRTAHRTHSGSRPRSRSNHSGPPQGSCTTKPCQARIEMTSTRHRTPPHLPDRHPRRRRTALDRTRSSFGTWWRRPGSLSMATPRHRTLSLGCHLGGGPNGCAG